MTAEPPDPDPVNTPGLEAGGGVAPGTTPPAAAQTSGVAEPEPPARGRFTTSGIVTVVSVSIFVVLFVAVAVLLILKMVGVFG